APALLSPDQGMHHLEAAHMRAEQQGAAACGLMRQHQLFAFDRDVEFFKLAVDEVDAIVNGGREAQDLKEPIARRRRPAEGETQILQRMAPGTRSEQEEVRGDAVQNDAAGGASAPPGKEGPAS